MKLIPVIMSGGVGSRLLPVSRVSHLKPFIPLPDGESLIQKTFARACGLSNVEEIVTVNSTELCNTGKKGRQWNVSIPDFSGGIFMFVISIH